MSISGQESLAAINQIYVIHEAMNGSIYLLLLARSHAIITPGSANLEF